MTVEPSFSGIVELEQVLAGVLRLEQTETLLVPASPVLVSCLVPAPVDRDLVFQDSPVFPGWGPYPS